MNIMQEPAANILGILVDNLKKRRSVLHISRRRATGWCRDLGIPRGGETVLYTGHMYQIMPAIGAMAKKMLNLEGSRITGLFGIGRAVNRIVDLAPFLASSGAEEKREADEILRRIAGLLKTAGAGFGYLYGAELYSGALIYDEGVDDVFREHALRVRDLLRKEGVRKIITVDPHTTNMFRSVYPEVVEGFDIEVKSYLEVLAEADMKPKKNLDRDVVIHDSCVYARYENIVDEPRKLLERAGARVVEPEFSGRLTHCCGGPVESLYPGKASAVAKNRIEQLAAYGANVAAMCPICLVNLRHAAEGTGLKVGDISEYLAEAY